MGSVKNKQKTISELVAKNQTSKALHLLQNIASKAADVELKEGALLQAARYASYRQAKIAGILTFAEARQHLTEIQQSILQLSENIPSNNFEKPFEVYPKKWIVLLGAPLAIVFIGIALFYYFENTRLQKPNSAIRQDSTAKTSIQMSTFGANSPAIYAPEGEVDLEYSADSISESKSKK